MDQDKISNEYEWGKLRSSITSVLNKKNQRNQINSSKTLKNKIDEANILYGMVLNTYRFNKYFTDQIKKELNFKNAVTLISKNLNAIKKLWNDLML